MADSVRIVRFTAGGQIEELLHVQSSLDYSVTNMGFERDSLEFGSGDRNQRMVKSGSRYGGERYAGESLANGSYKFRLLASGASADALLTKVSTLIGELERVPGQHYIEHQMDGATFPSYYEVRAPARRSEIYKWAQATSAGSMVLDIDWPVAPLVCGAPMDIALPLVTGALPDFEFDASTAASIIEDATDWSPNADLTAERRFIHVARGYEMGDHEVFIQGMPHTTITGFKLAAEVKRIDDENYVECYVDDNGVNSRLRIDKIYNGARTNLATTNLGARVSSGVIINVIGRIVGGVVTAEYRTADPTGGGAPITSVSYTLSPGSASEGLLFGIDQVGFAGGAWIPQHASSALYSFRVNPFTYVNQTWPQKITLGGDIPGDAPSCVDLHVQSSASDYAYAMFAWHPAASSDDGTKVFAIRQAEDASSLTGWASTVDANCMDGDLASANTAGAVVLGDTPSSLYAGFSGMNFWEDVDTPGGLADLHIEVWAAVRVASTVVNPRFRAMMVCGSRYIFTSDYGREGKVVSVPSSGTRRRFVRLGVLTVPSRLQSLGGSIGTTIGSLIVDAGCDTGSTGHLGLDYVMTVPGNARSSSPTAKALDSDYPRFKVSSNYRVIRSDLSGFEAGSGSGVALLVPAPGLGGSRIEIEPGRTAFHLKLSDLVPDDPTSDATAETATETATVHLGVIPRWHYQRPN